jgi:peptidoglycan hydrolase CwlO-like protein
VPRQVQELDCIRIVSSYPYRNQIKKSLRNQQKEIKNHHKKESAIQQDLSELKKQIKKEGLLII